MASNSLRDELYCIKIHPTHSTFQIHKFYDILMCNFIITNLFPHEQFNIQQRCSVLNIHVPASFATLNLLEVNIVCEMQMLTFALSLLVTIHYKTSRDVFIIFIEVFIDIKGTLIAFLYYCSL